MHPDVSSTLSRVRRPIVSVCIANYNCRELLRACLRSLSPRRQRLRLEVIVVDNASTDGASDMVEREFPDVVLVRNPSNAGFARANNQAAQVATGRYLFFLNNDTVVRRGTLKQLIQFHRTTPDVGLIGPLLRDGRGRSQASARRRPTVPALLHRLTLLRWTGLFRSAYRRYRGRDTGVQTRPVEVLMGAALLMPRRIWREIGGWDESYTFGGEDIDLCARVAQRYQVVYHAESSVRHYGRAASRLRPGWAGAMTLIGITHSLRVCGSPRWARLLYKTLFTLDLPVKSLALTVRYLWCRARNRPRPAQRAWLELCGLAWFSWNGLWTFWRA